MSNCWLSFLFLSLALSVLGCTVRTTMVEEVQPRDTEGVITFPLRAQLIDGREALFPEGGRFENGTLVGRGFILDVDKERKQAPDSIHIQYNSVAFATQIVQRRYGKQTVQRIAQIPISIDDGRERPSEPGFINNFVRVHLNDGRTAIFPNGVHKVANGLTGFGWLIGLEGHHVTSEQVTEGLPYGEIMLLELVYSGIDEEKSEKRSRKMAIASALGGLALTIVFIILLFETDLYPAVAG